MKATGRTVELSLEVAGGKVQTGSKFRGRQSLYVASRLVYIIGSK
jgi:hypothetical protein